MIQSAFWILFFLPASLSGGNDGLSLQELSGRYELEWKSDASTGREILEAKGFRLVLSPGMKTVLFNGKPIRLSRPAILRDGKVYVSSDLVRQVSSLVPLRTQARTPVVLRDSPVQKWFRVVIDPGHGGVHSGGKGGGMMEKDINLDVSLRLGKVLEMMGGVVTYTRVRDRHFNSEVYADLQHRVDVVNRKKPDVFVSIHVNYVPDPDPQGFEIWIRKGDRACRRLGDMIRQEFVVAFQTPDRGLKDNRALYVLRKTSCPAVLVELGFISNSAERAWLADGVYRQRYAEAVARGVKKYLASGK